MKLWIRRIIDFVDDTKDEHINAFAGQSAFFVFLSIFPLLNLLLMLTPFLPYTQEELVELILRVVPRDLGSFVSGVIEDIFANNTTSLTIISLGAGLWSSAKGIEAIRNGLNEVYRARVKSNFLLSRAIGVFYTIILIFVILVLAFINLFGDQVGDYLVENFSETAALVGFIVRIRGAVTFALAFFVILLLYTIMPRRKLLMRFQMVGAFLCAGAMVLITWGFSFYISYTMKKSAMYGSLTAIILLLFWLYIIINVFFWCAQVNEFLYLYRYKSKAAIIRARKREKSMKRKARLIRRFPFLKKIFRTKNVTVEMIQVSTDGSNAVGTTELPESGEDPVPDEDPEVVRESKSGADPEIDGISRSDVNPEADEELGSEDDPELTEEQKADEKPETALDSKEQ